MPAESGERPEVLITPFSNVFIIMAPVLLASPSDFYLRGVSNILTFGFEHEYHESEHSDTRREHALC